MGAGNKEVQCPLSSDWLFPRFKSLIKTKLPIFCKVTVLEQRFSLGVSGSICHHSNHGSLGSVLSHFHLSSLVDKGQRCCQTSSRASKQSTVGSNVNRDRVESLCLRGLMEQADRVQMRHDL